MARLRRVRLLQVYTSPSHDRPRRRADDGGQNPAVGVNGVDPLPERLRYEEREEAAQAAAAERAGQTGQRDDHDEKPGCEMAGERKPRDDDQGRRRDEVVEDDQPNAAVAIEEGAGDRADDQAREDAGKGHEPGERRVVVPLKCEQDHDDPDHRLRDAGDLHGQQDAPKRGHAQQCTI